jgi:hypothetical protein
MNHGPFPFLHETKHARVESLKDVCKLKGPLLLILNIEKSIDLTASNTSLN